jgi:glycosyltransferase involved in cell wall biosynthesis
MPSKVAVVVFVKNEYPDFCAWLAWYFALGVDTVIVYDDHSTDGTWQAVQAASRCLDIRPFRTDLSVTPFTARQKEVYLGAIRQFRDEFEWIGFLDADEYLHLRHNVDLRSFLARFPDAGAIAFSWCIYGSNFHLLKPAASTVEAFTRHSTAGFGHNRSVKSFVRPKAALERWRDPHTFEIGGRPYVDPRGNPVRWGGPGAIAHDPDWSVAKLMHFIPRSMEHFVERIRRRSDLQGVTNEYWNVFDKNDVEDPEPLERIPAANNILFRINEEIMTDFCRTLPCNDAEDPSDRHSLAGSPPLAVAHAVRTCFGTMLAVDDSNRLCHVAQEDSTANGCSPVYALSSSSVPDILHLVAPQTPGPLQAPRDPRVSSILTYRVQRDSGEHAVSLKLPRAQRYLTALPGDSSKPGATSSDRWKASEWERFTLVCTDAPDDNVARYDALLSITNNHPTATGLRVMARAGMAPMICAAGMQLLSEEQRDLLTGMTSAVTPSWV